MALSRPSKGAQMAKIYWRNGWAWARATVKGVERRDPLGTRAKREAEERFQKWLAEIDDERRPGAGRRLSFRKAVEKFTDEHMAQLEKQTQRRYLESLVHLCEDFDRRDLADISRKDLMAFMSRRRKAGVTSSTIIRDLACLSSVFTVAEDWEIFEGNPVKGFLRAMKKRKVLVNAPPRNRYLSHQEELSVLEYALARACDPAAIRRKEKAMIAAAIALYVDLGLRAQELLHARRAWVNWNRNEFTIPRDFTKADRDRTVPLLPRARYILEALPENKHTDLLLWRCDSGKRFSDLNKSFQAIAETAKVSEVHIHDLRRTCGCRLLQDHGLKMAEVSNWLGHESVKQTETTYAFLKVENLHDAIGGRVIEKTARLRLAEVFDGGFAVNFTQTPAHSKANTIEKPRQIAVTNDNS